MPTPHQPIRKDEKHPVRLLLWLLLSILIIFTVYQIFVIRFEQFWLFVSYYILAAAVGVAYVAYNFGLTRMNVTPDMLPVEWTAEEKFAYIAEGQVRKRKSRFLLIILFGFIVTLAYDMAVLFLPDIFGGVQGVIDSWFS